VLLACSLGALACAPRSLGRQAHAEERRQELARVFAAQYEALKKGDPRSFVAPLAANAFVIGPVATQTVVGREAAERLAAELMRAHGAEPSGPAVVVDTQGAQIGLSEDGNCAWSYDELTVTTGSGHGYFRVTALAHRRPAGWEIAAVSWTVPVGNVEQALLSGGFAAPAAMTDHAGPGAEPLREDVLRWVGGEWRPWKGRTDSFFIETAAENAVAVGDEATNARAAALLGSNAIRLGTGGLYSELACDGDAGFVGYNVTLDSAHAGHPLYVPMRGLDFYVRDDGAFRRVLTQTALGLRF